MPVTEYGLSTFPLTLAEVENNNISRSVAQTMLSDAISLETIYRLAASRLFYFGAFSPGGQEVTHNFIYADIDNGFGFSNIAGYDWEVNITQYLGLTDRYFVGEFGNYLGLNDAQRVNRVYSASASNAIAWSADHAGLVAPYALERAYTVGNSMLDQMVYAAFVHDAVDYFDLEGALDSSATEFEREFTDSCAKQHVTFKITGGDCPGKEYAPHIGSSDGPDVYPAVPAAAPVLTSGTLTLTHPRVSPTLTLVLKNPDFGNTDILDFAKIDRKTRGGDRKIFSDLDWGQTQSFSLTVTNLCTTTTLDQIITFLNTSLGEEIGLTDWEGRVWKGIIVAPESDVASNAGGYRVDIIFEGELA